MRISRTNNLVDGVLNTDYSITAGGILDGSAEDIVNPDFSYFPTISGTLIRINVASTSAEFPSDYFALHGIRFNAQNKSLIRATVYSNSVQIDTLTIRSGSSLFFTREESNADWYVEFSSDDAIPIVITVSYISCGMYTEFPRNGVRGGEYIPYLGNNRSTLATSNQLAQPVTRRVKKVAKMVTIKCPNAPIEWLEDDLQDVFDLYNETGILSVQMIEDSASKAFAGYDLEDDCNISGVVQSKLAAVTLRMKSTL